MKKTIFLLLVLLMFVSSIPVHAAVVLNRTSSTFSATSSYRSYMTDKMNCYGYAIHVYYPGGGKYKQQPGEFTNNTEAFSSLMNSYYNAANSWNNLYAFVKDRIYEDFATLSTSESEWTISETTASAAVPSGKRKIALTIRQSGMTSDYHFYLRHDDGKWSHKRGELPITDLSIDTETVITDSNIASKSIEGGYVNGTRYFLIGKSAVVDYPHYYGQNASTQYTQTDFRDKAGDVLTKSYKITNSWNSRFDYPDDVDFFEFTPTTSKYYTISTDRGSGYDIDGIIYDADGNIIASDFTTSNASFNIYLTSGKKIYIKINDAKKNTGYYILWCS